MGISVSNLILKGKLVGYRFSVGLPKVEFDVSIETISKLGITFSHSINHNEELKYFKDLDSYISESEYRRKLVVADYSSDTQKVLDTLSLGVGYIHPLALRSFIEKRIKEVVGICPVDINENLTCYLGPLTSALVYTDAYTAMGSNKPVHLQAGSDLSLVVTGKSGVIWTDSFIHCVVLPDHVGHSYRVPVVHFKNGAIKVCGKVLSPSEIEELVTLSSHYNYVVDVRTSITKIELNRLTRGGLVRNAQKLKEEGYL